MVLAGDFDAQVRKLRTSEACLIGGCALTTQRKDNRHILLGFRIGNHLVFSSTAFRQLRLFRDLKFGLDSVGHTVLFSVCENPTITELPYKWSSKRMW